MASTGKKTKKAGGKNKKMTLQSFLAEDSEAVQAGYSVVTARRSNFDWAAEVEREGAENADTAVDFNTEREQQYILPSAPLGPNVDMSKVPTSPPYTAFLGGLPFNIEKDDIINFFKNLKVASVRFPRDKSESADKGGEIRGMKGRKFGYVEFEDRQSLIDALGMNEKPLNQMKIKVDVADNQDDPSRRRDKPDRNDKERSERIGSDWRSGPREEPMRPPERNLRDDRDRSDTDRGYGGSNFDRGLSNDRDKEFGGGFRDRERGGGYGGGYRSGGSSSGGGGGGGGGGGSDRYSYDRDNYNGNDRSEKSYDRDRSGRGNRREYGSGYRNDDRYSGYRNRGTRSDNYDRNERHYNDSGYEGEMEREVEKEAPKERRKLVLQPRTKPLEDASKSAAPSAIFGGARPVDTASKEREIEERLSKQREITTTKPAAESSRSGGRDSDREYHRDDNRDSDTGRRLSSSSSQARSPRSSTSVPPYTSAKSWDGASNQSETDDDKPPHRQQTAQSSKPAPPTSPKNDEPKAMPAPPPKENAWTKQRQHGLFSDSAKAAEVENKEHYEGAPRSDSVSSAGSDSDRQTRKITAGSEQYNKSNRKDDNAGYNRRSDDNRSYRDRNDRGGAPPRGGRGGQQRGGGGGGGNRGQDYSREQYQRERPQREMLKYEEPEIPSYASENKFNQLGGDFED